MSEFVPDSIVQSIIERFQSRAEFGYKKYNTNLDRTDLSPDQWAQHALEETHDFMLYITKWKNEQAKHQRLLELSLRLNDAMEIFSQQEHLEFLELRKWYRQHTK
jgi:hypothetical protein